MEDKIKAIKNFIIDEFVWNRYGKAWECDDATFEEIIQMLNKILNDVE